MMENAGAFSMNNLGLIIISFLDMANVLKSFSENVLDGMQPILFKTLFQ